MLLSPKFFYDDAANENAGGSANEGQSQEILGNEGAANAENKEGQAAPDVKQPEISDEIKQQLAELEELRKYKAEREKPTPSEEEKKKADDLDRAEMRKFAIKNDIAKDEDFTKYETLQQKKDIELVKDDFVTQFKADNKEDFETEEELSEAADEAFKDRYPLDHANKTIKSKAEKLLAKEAAEIRNPYASKITDAQTKYETEKSLTKQFNEQYIPFTEEVKKSIPQKLEFSKVKIGEDGKEEVSIEVDVTAEDLQKVEDKFFKDNPKTFYEFIDGKYADGKLTQKITNFLLAEKRAEGNQKLANEMIKVGIAKGSNVGAENPFALTGNQGQPPKGVTETLEESNKRIGALRAKYAPINH